MIHSIRTVRVGIEVERNDLAFSFRMFHCRSRDMGDDKHVPLADWAYDEISMLNIRSGLPGQQKLKVGESARYWVHMRMIHTSDYWGEHDNDIEILKCRRAK